MSSVIDPLAQGLIDHLFRTASYAKPTQWWVGLIITMGTDAGTGFVEPVGGGYVRIQSNPSDANWTRTGRIVTNIGSIQYPVPSADWGLIAGVALYAASSGGNPLLANILTLPIIDVGGPGRGEPQPVNVKAGDSAVRFDTGQLQFYIA
jgi:hypothetical protein